MKYLALLFLIPGVALGHDYAPEFQWEGPTQFVSGKTLDPLTDLSEYRLYCSPSIPQQTLPATDTTWQAPLGLFPPGEYTCYMTSVSKGPFGGSARGIESAKSGEVTFTVHGDQPGPIVIFEVN